MSDSTDFIPVLKKVLSLDDAGVNDLIERLSVDQMWDILDLISDGKTDEIKQIVDSQEKPLDEDYHDRNIFYGIGDKVKYNGEEATVKLPSGPNDSIGVMADGEFIMTDKKNIEKLDEMFLGVNTIGHAVRPDFEPRMDTETRRMQALAGIAPMNVTMDEDEDTAAFDAIMGAFAVIENTLPNLQVRDMATIREKINSLNTIINR